MVSFSNGQIVESGLNVLLMMVASGGNSKLCLSCQNNLIAT